MELHDSTIEAGLLGCFILSFDKTSTLIDKYKITPQWFMNAEHSVIFTAISKLKTSKAPVNIFSVQHYIKSECLTEVDIPISFIENLVDVSVSAIHCQHYIEILREMFIKRNIIIPICRQAKEDMNTKLSAMDIIARMRNGLDEMNGLDPLVINRNDIKKNIFLRREQAKNEGVIGVPSKFSSIQAMLGGYKLGKMCIIGARPSIGKTTYALNEICYHMLQENPIPTGFISLETDLEEIYEQLAADHLSINLFDYHNGNIKDQKVLKQMDLMIDWFTERPFYPTESRMNIDEVCFMIRMMSQKHNVKLLFIDYVQIISDNQIMKKMPTREKMNYISNRLFETIRECKVAGVVLAQLNRDAELPYNLPVEQRWNYIPGKEKLKESGKFDEDAYQIITLCPDPNVDDPKSQLTIDLVANIDKNKKGPTGKVFLTYQKHLQKMVSSGRSLYGN